LYARCRERRRRLRLQRRFGDGRFRERRRTDKTTAADKITCFSQVAEYLTALAPGVFITAAGVRQGGTSQAAPHVAGAVAAIADASPASSPEKIENALRNSGARWSTIRS
jgi:subtilisin family serine protease